MEGVYFSWCIGQVHRWTGVDVAPNHSSPAHKATRGSCPGLIVVAVDYASSLPALVSMKSEIRISQVEQSASSASGQMPNAAIRQTRGPTRPLESCISIDDLISHYRRLTLDPP